MVELRAALKARGLATAGKKAQLIDRLMAAIDLADVAAGADENEMSMEPGLASSRQSSPAAAERVHVSSPRRPLLRPMENTFRVPDLPSKSRAEAPELAVTAEMPSPPTQSTASASAAAERVERSHSDPTSACSDESMRAKVVALEEAMEETLADMEELDGQLTKTKARNATLEARLVRAQAECLCFSQCLCNVHRWLKGLLISNLPGINMPAYC